MIEHRRRVRKWYTHFRFFRNGVQYIALWNGSIPPEGEWVEIVFPLFSLTGQR